MKSWEFWLLLGVSVVTLYLVYRVATGLQAAQASVEKITNPLSEFGKMLGL